MITITDLDQCKSLPPLSAALGFFDGVHSGHKKLIKSAVDNARKKNISSAVVTLSEQPVNFLTGKCVAPILTSNEIKAELIEGCGVDYLILLPFNKNMSKMPAQDFVSEIIYGKLNIKYAFCGFNYNFGNKGTGSATALSEYGKMFGFEVVIIKPVVQSGVVVSSSYIRSLIQNGDIKTANKYLGYNFYIKEKVVYGNKIGKSLEYPTLNQYFPKNYIVPSYGVYATSTLIDGVKYSSVTNVGIRPTIALADRENMETFILDFNEDLYDKKITVEFVKKIRNEMRFKDIGSLKLQIDRDVECRR